MKTIEVVAAIIKAGDCILATQRGYGEFTGSWEFPGGKVEDGETQEAALEREIREELAANIEVCSFLTHVSYDYDTFHLEMDCYICSLCDEDFTLKEHLAAKWLNVKTIDSVNWLPADIIVVDAIKQSAII